MMYKNIIYKVVANLIIIIIMCGLLSCSQDEYIYYPTNDCVSFVDNTDSYVLNGKEIEIEINRGVAKTALSIDITLDEGSIFTLENPKVVFADGEYKAKVRLSYLQNGLMPGIEYGFTLRFSNNFVSASGSNEYYGEGLLPLDLLEYEDYGKIVFIGPTSEKYPSDVVEHMTTEEKTYTIQVAKYTNTYYRVKNFFNSNTNFDFVLRNDGNMEILSPSVSYDCPVYSSETYMFVSSAKYDGIPITAWFDADPSCITPYGYSETGYSVTVGTTIDFDAIFTIGNDYIPRVGSTQKWHAYETFEVQSVIK